jgi:DNA adenine methylase
MQLMLCHRNSGKRLLPFLKWAGGKRWLVEQYPDIFYAKYDRYVEPFLGGGAVFFAAKPLNAQLSDTNRELIECYEVMRDNPHDLSQLLVKHQESHSRDYYYKLRSTVPQCRFERAARFVYLNRTCFNGLYRVNLLGVFNVPIGTKTAVLIPTDDFIGTSQALKSAILSVEDFESVVLRCGHGDFVYLDPPYTVNHNNNGFLKYNEKIFSWADQIRLKAAALAAARNGAKVVVSNAAHSSVVELYKGDGEIVLVSRPSVLAADRSRRGSVQEILVVMR